MINAAQASEPQERVYGPLDYLLTGIYSCLAAYATGVSVGSVSAAWMFVGIIVAGTLFSFVVQWVMGEQTATRWDGIFYLGVATATFAFRADLAKIVPDQPFVDQLLHTGTLCWMLALGSFFTWRDGTLLFQAVPSIALFGMVGAFDTFKPAPILFFAFLLCLATLFARAHRRQMIEQAEASGYKAMLAQEEGAGGGARLKAIMEGPWKWMAGPEWALASALVIVIISALGAPTLRILARPLAGTIRVNPPPLTVTQSTALLGSSDNSRVTIGTGPQNLSDKIVVTAALDQKRYLRARTYANYDRSGWIVGSGIRRTDGSSGNLMAEQVSIIERSREELRKAVVVPFRINVLDANIGSLPVPGEIESGQLKASDGKNWKAQRRGDGTYKLDLAGESMPLFEGQSAVPANGVKPRDAAKNLPESMADYADATVVPPRVALYAKQVTKDAKTDYEKALAIKHAIEATCVYNLRAPATPAGQDPVEYFLFSSHQGYCDLFGSSMALMARAVGIPARYATGFYPIKGMHAANDDWAMSESEAHAWAELFFKDVGWIEFDATENAAEVPNEGRGDSTQANAWYRQQWFKTTLDVGFAVILLGGGLMLYLVQRKHAANRVLTRDDVGREYARYVAILQKQSGKRRLPSQTPDEFLSANEPFLGPHAPVAQRLNGRFVEALYSPTELSPTILKELRDGTESLRRELRSNGKATPTAVK